jgi:hypothetical protein
MASVTATAALLTLGVGLSGALRFLSSSFEAPRSVAKIANSFGRTLSHRGFWHGAKVDAAFYVRFIARRIAGARERSLSTFSWWFVR